MTYWLARLSPCPLLTSTSVKRRALPARDISILNETERRTLAFLRIVVFVPTVYLVFLPLKLQTIWFHVGRPITPLALIMCRVVRADLVSTLLSGSIPSC